MATRFSGISKQHRVIRHNVVIWCAIYLLLFLLLIGRLAFLQLVKGGYYRQMADRYHARSSVLPAIRGSIRDRNGKVLALDDDRESLFVDPVLVKFPLNGDEAERVDSTISFSEQNNASAFVARQLAPVILRPEQDIFADITHEPAFVWLQRDVAPEVTHAIPGLALPGIQVKQDGVRSRVGLDLAAIPHSDGFAGELADALDRDEDEITRLIAPPPPKKGEPAVDETAPQTGVRWLDGTVNDDERVAAKHLLFPGVLFDKAGPNYSIGADPRLYQCRNPKVTAETAAALLASKLGLPPDTIAKRLLVRPRFVWLKRGLSISTTKAVQRLESTIYVVQPGKVLESRQPGDEYKAEERLTAAVNTLYDIINERKGGKHAVAAPEILSREAIRQHLLPNAQPGPLAIKMDHERPSLLIARQLFAKPIPGIIYGLPGIGMQQERRREYPYGKLAAQTLGFVGDVNERLRGVFGVELTQDKTLHGTDGLEEKEIDGRRMTIPERSQRTEPIDGKDVTLTLNLDIQQAAETELAKTVESSKALSGTCVVLDPKSGEILALATSPGWDANFPGKSTIPLLNPVVSNYYEPGSTFKLVAVMGALEEGKIHPGEIVTNCNGAKQIGNHVIHEAHHAHGQVDCKRLLEQSCNLGAATLALKLGPDLFLKWCDRMGFGKRTGVELKNESSGSLNRRNAHEAQITLANMGFGQSMTITPIQLAAGYSVVANGGVWVQPHLVRRQRARPDGQLEDIAAPRRQVCSKKTAQLLLDYLENVVVNGTGKASAIDGYRVAGKTGTAQKPVPGRGYHGGKYIASFVGLMPVEDPRLAIVAIIDEPKGSIYGGAVAAPIVKEVGRQALQFLNIPSDPKLIPKKKVAQAKP